MRTFITFASLAVLCTYSVAKPSICTSYASDLNAMVQVDQALREHISYDSMPLGKVKESQLPKIFQQMAIVDRVNTARLVKLVRACGWPRNSVHGQQATGDAWMLVQHAEPEAQRRLLPLVEAAVKSGEASPSHLAYLADRVCATSLSANAETLTVTTDRGAKVEVLADFPAGPGPFPAIVLAPGQGYHMTLPALEQTAKRLVSQGVAVYRFNWAYFTATPKTGSPSEDLTSELQDMNAVLTAALAEPRVSRSKLSVGGKSLGTVVAWRAFVGNKSLQAGLFLTAVCSRVPKGRSVPDFLADENYPGVAAEVRPLLFISGDQDPLCAPPVLYRFAANSGGKARVAIVGGDHSFENNALAGDAANEARTRNIDSVAELAANFVSEVARR